MAREFQMGIQQAQAAVQWTPSRGVPDAVTAALEASAAVQAKRDEKAAHAERRRRRSRARRAFEGSPLRSGWTRSCEDPMLATQGLVL